jgi:hypothetical protein
MYRIMEKYFKYFVVLIMCYASFQYGRIHDEGVEYYSAEENKVVYIDRCEVVTDTSGYGTPIVIWYNDAPFTLAPEEWYQH